MCIQPLVTELGCSFFVYNQNGENKCFGISEINVLYVLNHKKLNYNIICLWVSDYYRLFRLFAKNHSFLLICYL